MRPLRFWCKVLDFPVNLGNQFPRCWIIIRTKYDGGKQNMSGRVDWDKGNYQFSIHKWKVRGWYIIGIFGLETAFAELNIHETIKISFRTHIVRTNMQENQRPGFNQMSVPIYKGIQVVHRAAREWDDLAVLIWHVTGQVPSHRICQNQCITWN